MRKNKFSINEEMHDIENPNGIPASISIGFGAESTSLEEGLQFADVGTELALSRGGDQTVIKNRVNFEFFGGRGFEIEKRTKVKSRVMANTLSELIRDSSKVFVMGHKFADLDAVGADVGICCLARKLGVKAQIVVEPNYNASKTLIERMKKEPEYKDIFLSPQEALISADARTLRSKIPDCWEPAIVSRSLTITVSALRISRMRHSGLSSRMHLRPANW